MTTTAPSRSSRLDAAYRWRYTVLACRPIILAGFGIDVEPSLTWSGGVNEFELEQREQELNPGSVREFTGASPRLADASLSSLAETMLARFSGAVEIENPEYVYLLLGTLHAKIGRHLNVPSNRFSVRSSGLGLERLRGHPDFDGSVLEDATCVDVGAGGLNPLGTSMSLVLHGAARAIAIEPDPVDDPATAGKALYDLTAAALLDPRWPLEPVAPATLLERLEGFDWRKILAGDPAGLDASRLQLMQVPFDQAGIEPETVDVLLTNSVLEHVPDPEAVIRGTSQIMKSGGLAVHGIDGRDHRFYHDSSMHELEMLRIPTDDALVHGVNRLRPLAYRALFEKYDLEVRQLDVTDEAELTQEEIDSFAEPFRRASREELQATVATYCLRKR